jgi:hypothetical protein
VQRVALFRMDWDVSLLALAENANQVLKDVSFVPVLKVVPSLSLISTAIVAHYRDSATKRPTPRAKRPALD